ncbi:hypothetical protein IQ13_0507 [Lacibacter cauensis]|uniref:Uncharacterized protein n=1 Tax=Lacibacter cauensis TaxID=510947 RepID=A0A562SVM7_9BACT|nr:hypothetical protein [Lacibacter cauensis]TWI85347.1 hypothetical protein IQ13_0507 [Lacibacter cauensis]
MEPIYYYVFGAAAVVFIALAVYLRIKGKKELLEERKREALEQEALKQQQAIRAQQPKAQAANPEMIRLQLQAYERMTILCERIGLTNLLGRLPVNQLSATELQNLMVQSIKTEFEYNVSQQLYVSQAAWDGIKNLKEQNIFIVNELASTLAPNATGADLSKKIVELLSHDDHVSLQNIVSSLINHEAKQLMN